MLDSLKKLPGNQLNINKIINMIPKKPIKNRHALRNNESQKLLPKLNKRFSSPSNELFNNNLPNKIN
jgi:hypothetical protein